MEARRKTLIERERVDLVIDVGANEGQYAKGLRKTGYGGSLVSVEPLASAHSVLSEAASRDPEWHVVQAAIGSQQGRMEINVAGNSASSSLLPMLDRHVSAAPESAIIGRELVDVETLDSVIEPYIARSSATFVKADVQGYEVEVVKGAGETLDLDRVVGVELELSLVPLYEGQPLLVEVADQIRGHGFVPVALGEGFRDPVSDELLSVDGLFVRAEAGAPAKAGLR